jgi:glycerophosphoryl diester phosphodiesterase
MLLWGSAAHGVAIVGPRLPIISERRHTDIVGILRACGASSVSIELDMFHPDDGHALHAAGCSNRVSVPRPEQLAEYWRGGRDQLPNLVQWIAKGLIDAISGDDVPFIAKLVERAGRAG